MMEEDASVREELPGDENPSPDDDDDDDDKEDDEVINNDDDNDNDNVSLNDQDPDAEGDDTLLEEREGSSEHDTHPVTVEPSFALANSASFYKLCWRMEQLWKLKTQTHTHKKRKRRVTEIDKLQLLLPPKLLQQFGSQAQAQAQAPQSSNSSPPQSIFPLLRLLCPEFDGSRSFGLQESKLAKLYSQAMALPKPIAQQLVHFTNAQVVGTTHVGDFSSVLYSILQSRLRNVPSQVTIGDMNARLDELAGIRTSVRKSNHDWRQQRPTNSDTTSSSTTHKPPSKKQKKGPTETELRVQWLLKLCNGGGGRWTLSPLEHKWMIRIILGRVQMGLGFKTILNWYHPKASYLWDAHNSLKGVCAKLCLPEFTVQNKEPTIYDNNKTHSLSVQSYMLRSQIPIQFGIPFEPMSSQRTGFARVLTDVSFRHRNFVADHIQTNMDQHHADDDRLSCLALKHPTFCMETKLDGERMLFHIDRDGVVKIHSRRANWYSDLYSPVLGPAVRRAVGHWRMDMVLDGEVLAWDSGRQETVPFGNNRTIANLRRKWMQRNGLCETIDLDLHINDTTTKAMSTSMGSWGRNLDQPYELAGEECWLMFVVFDIVYLDGPGAADTLDKVVSSCIEPRPHSGSLIGLDAFERKKLLYHIVKPQKNEVEIVETVVVRPNGRTALGRDYFDIDNPILEQGIPVFTLDSIDCCLRGAIPNLSQIDAVRRQGRSDEEISQARARAIDRVYKSTVEDQRLEGLLFKDLSTPYYLGSNASKSLRYWHKFKPDFYNGSSASDLDVVIIGCYFATGLRHAGKPSSFLCACVDSNDNDCFLPLCKVNGRSMPDAELNGFLKSTGFRLSGEDGIQYGKWFREQEHGSVLPEFISRRSYQQDNEDSAWRYNKLTYPDLWIHPNDSAVVVLNAGEIVYTDAFAAGVTLRFPRITRLRMDTDEKAPHDIESDKSLHKIYQQVITDRASQANQSMPSSNATSVGSPSKVVEDSYTRFLTEEQFLRHEKKRRTVARRRSAPKVRSIKDAEQVDDTLVGMKFTVLSGVYIVDEIDIALGKEEGWLTEAQKVVSSADVQVFIKSHGGIVTIAPTNDSIVLGGRGNDARVEIYVNGLTKTSQQGKVVRWTYVFSLVQRIKREGKERRSPVEPNALDCLRQVPALNLRQLAEVPVDSLAQMQRAVDLSRQIQRENESLASQNFGPWQFEAARRLMEQERWILSCGNQALWPYSKTVPPNDASLHKTVILYPDIFPPNDLGHRVLNEDTQHDQNDRWTNQVRLDVSADKLTSCLPLARIMGALVTPHFHNQVTHVLCNLPTEDAISSQELANSFPDHVAKALLDRLDSFENSHQVTFVSPTWIRRRFSSHQY